MCRRPAPQERKVDPLSRPELISRLIALKEQFVAPAEHYLADEVTIIGRGSNCHVVVSHPLASRLHARVEREGVRYFLADAGSANGTFVNGQRLTGSHLLNEGDQIGLGEETPILLFRDPEATIRSARQLRYDEGKLRFVYGSSEIALTPNELLLLRHLYKHIGNVCSRDSCAQAVWSRPYHQRDSGAMDQLVSTLRQALREAGAPAELVHTVRGFGYMLQL